MHNYLTKNQVEKISERFLERTEKEQSLDVELVAECADFFTGEMFWQRAREAFFKYVLSYTTLPDFIKVETEDDRIAYAARFLTGFMMNLNIADFMMENANLFSIPEHFQEYRKLIMSAPEMTKALLYGDMLATINDDFAEDKESRLIIILSEELFAEN
jgi:hypothetical protein